MRRVAIAVIGVVLMMPATGLGQTDAEIEELMEAFSRRAQSDALSIQVVHMNDITTDFLFEAPAKYALRAQARGATMFFVQGEINQEGGYAVDMDWRVLLGSTRSIRAQTVSISNFEVEVLQAGEQFSGIIALEELLSLNQPIRVQNANWRFEFAFPSNVLSQLETAP